MDSAPPERGQRVVALGGGNGLSCLLSGLKPYVGAGAGAPFALDRLTAVVTVTDDGGSSGRLREEFQLLPPGDIRNCMIALAEDEALMTRLFQYRFESTGNLGGHSFGNLFLAALTGVTGDFCRAVQLSSEVLAIAGDIYPSTASDVHLVAELEDGRRVRGETDIARSGAIRRLELDPPDCRPLPETLAALSRADLVVLGPGSLFTSVVAPLLVPGICAAIRSSPARTVYVCNVMTQPGESDGLDAWEHYERVAAHCGRAGLVDCVLANDRTPSASAIARYHAEGQERVAVDGARFERGGVELFQCDLLSETDTVRHDPAKLARAVLRLAAATSSSAG